MTWLAIALAAAGALFLAVAARLQHQGVRATGMKVPALLRNRRWLTGGAMLGTGTGLHLVALALAPLAVVQPIGAMAPALTTAMNARADRTKARRTTVAGVVAVAAGVGLFVVVAAQQPTGGEPVRYAEGIALLVVGLAVAAAVVVVARTTGVVRSLASAIGGGMALGLVSTLARGGMQEFFGSQRILPLVGTAGGMLLAVVVGSYLVQQAYSSGPAELVIATVTVFDPLVSIGLGAALLGEAPAPTPGVLALEGVGALIAVIGVVLLARTEKTTSSAQEADVTTGEQRRILIGADTFPPDINGAANFGARLAVGLAARGHDVHVVCPETVQTGQPMPRLPGVTVHRFPAHLTPFHPTLTTCLPWQVSGPIGELVDELRPDVVHIQAHFAMGRILAKIARRKDIPLVATNHFVPDNAFGYTRMPGWTRSALSRLAWRDLVRFLDKADVVTTPTPRAAELLTDHGLALPVTPISCGIDAARYQGEAPKDHPPTVLFVGRLDEEKRVPDILHALVELPGVRLEVVGDGACRDSWQALAGRLHIADRVVFHGFVSDSELTAAYARCDVFCMPSTAELQSLVTMEAMAAGKPVVAADAMALPHLVRPGRTGSLFTPGDVSELAACLRKLLDDPELAGRMGAAGRELVAQHGIETTISRYEKVYESVRPQLRELPYARELAHAA
ncbi:glycosyltransferase [Fodinicola acaciae]|uniref:glycosyltransferase n=1 Tax=Fodinicola acaciae TaxID=2681555 RepID=UPI0013D67C23|nr:glycosyltransferase [Fodinicola acaciae]